MSADSQSNSFQTHFSDLQEQLACPACYGALCVVEQQVVCSACSRSYPIVDGIPVLIAEQALGNPAEE